MQRGFHLINNSYGSNLISRGKEAQAAQSKKDFILKMSIASKEARETNYWLKLLEASDYLDDFKKKNLLMSESIAIMKIITKIVKTSSLNNS